MQIDDDVAPDEWDEQWNKFERASFFQSRAWAEVLSRAFPRFSPLALRVTFETGESTLLPGIVSRRGPGRLAAFYSMPFNTYGGLLGNATISATSANQLGHYLRSRFSFVEITPNPIEINRMILPSFQPSNGTTNSIPLESGFEDIWLHHFDAQRRNQYRRAEKLNTEWYASNSSSAFEEYWILYQESCRRWGYSKPPYPRRLFEVMGEKQATNIQLWIARAEGKTIAALLVFYDRVSAFYWGGAMLEDAGRFYANTMLFRQCIENACQRGLLYFNLGASSHLDGVERFKASLGSTVIPCSTLTYADGWYRFVKGLSSLRQLAVRE